MKTKRTKKYYLYLNDTRLLGVEWHSGTARKVIDSALDEPLPKIAGGEAILLLNREKLQHHIVPLPSQGKFSIHKVMAHEAATLMDLPPTDIIYDWRTIGNEVIDEIPNTLYLLAGHEQDEIVPLLERLTEIGLKVRNVVTYLDILIEKGRALKIDGGSGLMVFEEPLVHFLFFRDGIYGFERTFELRKEGFEKDFLLEIQRSFFYAKQKFKIPVDNVSVLMPPPWLQGDLAQELQETLEVPVEYLGSPDAKHLFPEDPALTLMINEASLVPSLLNLLPTSLIRERETRRFSYAVSFTEVVLLVLLFLFARTTYQTYQEDLKILEERDRQLKIVETQMESERQKLDRFKRIKQETSIVERYLEHKKNVYLYFETLPYLIPRQIYLETLFWGSETNKRPVRAASHPATAGNAIGKNTIVLIGSIDDPSPEHRFSLFSRMLESLQSAPFVETITSYSDDLLVNGEFQIDVHVKQIKDDYDCTD